MGRDQVGKVGLGGVCYRAERFGSADAQVVLGGTMLEEVMGRLGCEREGLAVSRGSACPMSVSMYRARYIVKLSWQVTGYQSLCLFNITE